MYSTVQAVPTESSRTQPPRSSRYVRSYYVNPRRRKQGGEKGWLAEKQHSDIMCCSSCCVRRGIPFSPKRVSSESRKLWDFLARLSVLDAEVVVPHLFLRRYFSRLLLTWIRIHPRFFQQHVPASEQDPFQPTHRRQSGMFFTFSQWIVDFGSGSWQLVELLQQPRQQPILPGRWRFWKFFSFHLIVLVSGDLYNPADTNIVRAVTHNYSAPCWESPHRLLLNKLGSL